MDLQYKGARWYKCDLHLHTPASRCFQNQQVTPAEWVQACIDAGLQCVAVTDHNTGVWIDQIKEAAKGKGLTVFPGVEITCDTSKIHLLVIFDTTTTSEQVNDFLIECGIARASFASSDAFSTKTVVEIAQIADGKGAVVIPAHIDEFNGLGYCAGKAQFEAFIKLPFIHASHFVHSIFLDPNLQVKDNQDLLDLINHYYGKEYPAIGLDNIKNAYDAIQSSLQHNLRLLTFSDNPDSENPTKHGLSGIGSRYSWIKMDGKPSIEGLRQAFMMPERTCDCFTSDSSPYKLPDLWIKRIIIKNTALTNPAGQFQVNFNPQLTTIIGGRGSGKSSILRFLRGVFGRDTDLRGLDEILQDQKDFFKLTDENGKGVLCEDSRIEVIIIRNELEYRVVWEYGKMNYPKVERLNVNTNQYESIEDEAYLDFFTFEEYSQKQIFSIAQKPNSLRTRIDGAIPEMTDVKAEYKQARQDYRELKTKERTLRQMVAVKGKLITEIKDLQAKIELLKQTGIANLINQRQQFTVQIQRINSYLRSYGDLTKKIEELFPLFDVFMPFESAGIEEKYRAEIQSEIQRLDDYVRHLQKEIQTQYSEMKDLRKDVIDKLKESSLIRDNDASKVQFEESKKILEERGITDMADFQKYTDQIEEKGNELLLIAEKEKELQNIIIAVSDQKQKIFEKRERISQLRYQFVNDHINSADISIVVHPYMDKHDWETKLRRITQKQTSYDRGFDTARDSVYDSIDIKDGLDNFRRSMHLLHDSTIPDKTYGGWFTKLIQDLAPNQLDEIDMLYPEDEIEMRYKGRDGILHPISVASAGQKTTAILSFILSFGKTPLILDQPEDDLDNRLVSQLIVEQIRKIKAMRQVIVVTHNANIPVNGDAEFVISMASDTPYLKVQAQGTVESDMVKKEICEVMEGGVEAFNTRAERYSSLTKK